MAKNSTYEKKEAKTFIKNSKNTEKIDEIIKEKQLGFVLESDNNKSKKYVLLIILFALIFGTFIGFAFSFINIRVIPIDPNNLNLDTNGDGISDLNVDLNADKICDINCDTNADMIPNYNIDYNHDLKPHFNLDTNSDGLPDKNVLNQDTNDDGKCDINCDTNSDGFPEKNIDVDGDGVCDINCVKIKEPSTTSNIKTSTQKEDESTTEPDPEELVEGFNVFDSETKWEVISDLKIFVNPTLEFKEIVAPGSIGTYVFRVRNNNDFNVKYEMHFMHENPYNINMKYRLKGEDAYLKGASNTWVNYDDLNIENIFLDAREHNEYTLEWKWIESSNDTEIGLTEGAKYKLSIEVTGTEI